MSYRCKITKYILNNNHVRLFFRKNLVITFFLITFAGEF